MMNEQEQAAQNLKLRIEDSIRQHLWSYHTQTKSFPAKITVNLGEIEHRTGVDVPRVTVKVE